MRDTTFALAIDVGSSRVTAAVVRDDRDAHDTPVLFSLSANENSASSAVFVDDAGTMHFGDAAEQLGAADPLRLVREFPRSVGGETPVVIGGHAVPAEEFFAGLCAWIVDEVAAIEDQRPDLIAVTHPSSWGGHRRERLRAALRRAGIDDPILVGESEAAAAHLEATHPVDPGQLLAVYDLGGTRFDARVLRRRTGGGYHPVGEQVRIDELGGANFDDELLRHVLDGVPLADDDQTGSAIAGAREAVVRAKELLSSAGDATVHFALPAGAASVRITRSEFEAMIDEDLDRTVEALDLAIESADAPADRLEAIVLAGGSSRIPLVAQRLSQRFDLPIIADADPQSAIALGAGRIAGAKLRDDDTAVGTALATIAPVEKTPAPRPQPSRSRTGILAFLGPIFTRRSRSTSPLLLAGAAVFIAITIVVSSTTAAGTRWPDYIQEAASGLLNLPNPAMPVKPTPSPTPASAPPGAIPVADRGTALAPRGSDEPNARQTMTPSLKSDRPSDQGTAPRSDAGGRPSGSKTPAVSSPGKPSTGTPGTTNPDTVPEDTTPGGTTPPDTTTPDTTPPDTTPPDTTTPDTTPTDTPPPDPGPVDPAAVDPAPSEPPADTAPIADPPAPEPTPGPAPEPV